MKDGIIAIGLQIPQVIHINHAEAELLHYSDLPDLLPGRVDLVVKVFQGFLVDLLYLQPALTELKILDCLRNRLAEFCGIDRLKQVIDGVRFESLQGIFLVCSSENDPVILFWNGFQKSKAIFARH